MSNFDYNQNHLDSTFEMELVIVGDDEHVCDSTCRIPDPRINVPINFNLDIA